MKTPAENSRQVVNRFLGKLGEPLSPVQVERAIGRVRDRLDEAEALSISASAPRTTSLLPWRSIAAAILVVLVGGAVQMVVLRPSAAGTVAKATGGQVYLAETYSPLSIASRIKGGQLLRAGSEGGAIALLDGSRIEMSPQSELSIVHASDGMRVRLGSGTVIVTAAKQREGHLYVETKDLLVSVVGTVFSVSTEAVGSRVSVIEGEVHVQQGQTGQTLLPGQQASTSPALGPLPVQTDLGWSPRAGELVALLQQSTPAPPIPAPATTPALQAVSRVVQGSVKLASKQEGIAGVTITACPGNAQRATAASKYANAELLFSQAGTTQGGPIIRNKTFFFALFDGVVGCPTPIQGKTDTMGRFQLQDVPPGDYIVRAEIEGYFGPAANGSYPAFASQSVSVDAQQPVPEISLSLVRGGTISGRVRDAEGRLLVNASVLAGVSAPVNGAGTFIASASKTTDDRGEYRLFSLPPGEYYVAVVAQGVSSRFETVGGGVVRYFSSWGIAPGESASATNRTFFPNTTSLSEATPVVLKEGEDVAGIDIVTRPPIQSDAPASPKMLLPVLRK